MNNQLQEIRTQKEAAVKESRRLRDLLYQSQGDLERARAQAAAPFAGRGDGYGDDYGLKRGLTAVQKL